MGCINRKAAGRGSAYLAQGAPGSQAEDPPQDSPLQVHPVAPSPSLYRNQRSHGAADPSQNQPGAEAAGLNAVQFLNLFVTWATTSCWRIREGANTQDLLSDSTFGSLHSCSSTQGCSVGPHSQRLELGWEDIKSGFPAPNRLEKCDVNHRSCPLLYPFSHCKHHREGATLLSPCCLSQVDHQAMSTYPA